MFLSPDLHRVFPRLEQPHSLWHRSSQAGSTRDQLPPPQQEKGPVVCCLLPVAESAAPRGASASAPLVMVVWISGSEHPPLRPEGKPSQKDQIPNFSYCLYKPSPWQLIPFFTRLPETPQSQYCHHHGTQHTTELALDKPRYYLAGAAQDSSANLHGLTALAGCLFLQDTCGRVLALWKGHFNRSRDLSNLSGTH